MNELTPPIPMSRSTETNRNLSDHCQQPRNPLWHLLSEVGKFYAKKLWIYLGPEEWGNELMCQVATEAFAADASLDAVQVNEHGGWFLTFLRDGTSSAPPMTKLISVTKPREFLHKIYGYDLGG